MDKSILPKILETLTFGDYTIVKYEADRSFAYRSYLENIDLSNVSSTVEEAILYCIAFKNLPLGKARAAAKQAAKILGVNKDEDEG